MKRFSIEVTVGDQLSQEKKDLIIIQLVKKFIEIAGDDFNGTCIIFSSRTENSNISKAQEETLSLADQEKKIIFVALEKHNGKRKLAAKELGISERTLYRKMMEFGLSQ